LLALAPALDLSGAFLAAVLSARPAAARIVAALAALAAAATGLALALPVLLGEPAYGATLGEVLPGLSVGLHLDGLSAWFVLLLSAVALPVAVAGTAYAGRTTSTAARAWRPRPTSSWRRWCWCCSPTGSMASCSAGS